MERRRAEGALLGLACGDALGTTLEFKQLPGPPEGQRLTGPHTDITGGGPFHVVPGQVTDDTHMACCVAAAIGPTGLDRATLAQSYVAWSRVTFDIGRLTSTAIGWIEQGDLEAGRRVWEQAGGDRPAPNGSLMRTAPIGVAYAGRPELRRQASFDDSALTHFDPRCQLACAAFNAAIASALLGAESVDAVVRAADDELRAASTALIERLPGEMTGWILEARSALNRDLHAAWQADPGLRDDGEDRLDVHGSAGYVRVAFRLAFWELVHAQGFEDGVIDVVNRGGDADTNGAIAGALLGAFFGVEAIPGAWRQRVLGAVPEQAALRDRFHPRELLAALGRWGF